jgi:hypothetical protein
MVPFAPLMDSAEADIGQYRIEDKYSINPDN